MRKFPFLVLSQVFLVSLALLSSCSEREPERPNIVFAIADDWGWPHAGAYGDPVVQTPNFDRVAGEGILFNHAYISSPSCTPSRNAILTGQYHWRLGPGANLHSTLDEKIPVYPLLLEDAGYYIGRYRKSWGPGNLDNWDRHPVGKEFPEGFESFLDSRPEHTPFCFWLGTSDPHRGYELGSGEASGIDPKRIKLFECFPDAPEIRGDVADYYYEVQRFDTLVGNAIAALESRGELENTIVVITGDHGMPFPRCKSNNYDSGARIPLAIMWGKKIKNPGRVLDDFISTTDLAPTFLELAGLAIPEVMTGKSLLGLMNSPEQGFVDPENHSFVLHGKERHVPGQEKSMEGYPTRAIRNHNFLYLRNYKPHLWPAGTPNYQEAMIPQCWLGDCDNGPTKTYMTENKEKDQAHARFWDLAFGKRPAEELYDCRKDPGQLINLAADPEYARIKQDLAAMLDGQLRATNDPRTKGDWPEIDEVPYLGHGPRHPSWYEANR